MILAKRNKTRLIRKLFTYLWRMLMLLMQFKFKEIKRLLKILWLRVTLRNKAAQMVQTPDKLMLLRQMMLLTEELHQTLGKGVFVEMVEKILYKGDKKLKVMADIRKLPKDAPKTRSYKSRSWPDRSRETFVKIGKPSPGLSPP
jgi:hypothetical protein